MDNRQRQQRRADAQADHRTWLGRIVDAHNERRARRRADLAERALERAERTAVGQYDDNGRPIGVHLEHAYTSRMVRGRHVRAPYRNPARTVRLARSGRLRRDLGDSPVELAHQAAGLAAELGYPLAPWQRRYLEATLAELEARP